MLKRLKKFYKEHHFLVICAVLLIISRIPSWLDPWWYGDENIYMAVGRGLSEGQNLYTEVWDNKPPLIYLIYSLSYSIFGAALAPLRILNSILAVLEIIVFYHISKNVFKLKQKTAKILTGVLTFFLATGLEGTIFNAENIFTPLILCGFYLFYREFRKEKADLKRLVVGAILWSLACFTKAPAAVEVCLLILVFAILIFKNTNLNFRKTIKNKFLQNFLLINALAISLPYLILIFLYRHDLDFLEYSLFGFSKNYIKPVNGNTFLGIDFGFFDLKLRLILLFISVGIAAFLYLKKNLSQKYFILISWLSATTFAILISERNYTHYLLQAFPVFILFFGMIFEEYWKQKINLKRKIGVLLSPFLITSVVIVLFLRGGAFHWNYFSPIHYFIDFPKAAINQNLDSWKRDYDPWAFDKRKDLGKEIEEKTEEDDKIYVVGNLPSLYFLSDRTSGGKYIADYHYLQEDVPNIYSELIKNETKLILMDRDSDKYNEFYKLISGDFQMVGVVHNHEFWIINEKQN